MTFMNWRLDELRGLAGECESPTEISKRMGVHISTVFTAAKRHGIKLPVGDRGPAPNPWGHNKARLQAIVAARKKGAKLQEIGDQWGLTRERVRQLLMRVRPDLCGNMKKLGLIPYKPRDYKCEHCGDSHEASSPAAEVKQRFCSLRCAGLSGPNAMNLPRMRAMYEAKLTGMTWVQVGRKFFPKGAPQPGSQACGAVRRYSKTTGIDVSAAYLGKGRQSRAKVT